MLAKRLLYCHEVQYYYSLKVQDLQIQSLENSISNRKKKIPRTNIPLQKSKTIVKS